MKLFKPISVLSMAAVAVLLFAWLSRDQTASLEERGAAAIDESPAPTSAAPREGAALATLARSSDGASGIAGPEERPSEDSIEPKVAELPAWPEALQQALAEADNAALLSLIRQTKAHFGAVERGAFLLETAHRLATTDPSRAASLLSEMDDRRDRHILAAAMTAVFVEHGASSATQWAERFSGSRVMEEVHELLGREWAKSDLDGALAWLGELSDGRAQTAAAEGLVWTWAQQDVREVAEWIQELPHSELRNKVLLKTAKVFATQDPAAAALGRRNSTKGWDAAKR